MSDLKITDIVLVHCNRVNNNYQNDSKFWHTFVLNKSFGQMSPKDFTFSETINSDFSYIEVWFTDQTSKTLGLEGKLNITLVINPGKPGRLFWLTPLVF